MTKLGLRIQKLLEKNNKTQKQLALDIGVTEVTVSRWVNGGREPKAEIITKIAQALNSTTDYLLGKVDHSFVLPNKAVMIDNFAKLPVLGAVRLGEPLFLEKNIIDYEYIANHNLPKGDLFCLKIVGDSMNLCNIIEGSIAVVRVQEEAENGDIVVVIVNGEDGTFKKFYHDKNIITLVPQSSNQAHLPRVINTEDISVKVVGKVVQAIIKF